MKCVSGSLSVTSLHNASVKAAAELQQKKYREERGLFLAEGVRTVEEALAARAVQKIFYHSEFYDESGRAQQLLEQAAVAGVKLIRVSAAVLRKLATTTTPQGVIAVCAVKQEAFTKICERGGLLLVLDRVSDPGNLGTLVRTADAAGVAAVVLLSGSADIYAPKVVRATMGSIFRLPIVTGISEAVLQSTLQHNGYELVATALEGATDLYAARLCGKRLACVLGNEATGVSDNLLAAASQRVKIPMRGQAESLNVAVAAGVLLFEILRQRWLNGREIC